MKDNSLYINIYPKQFSSKEIQFIRFGQLEVSGFIYPSGVQAVRVRNAKGEIVVLPFLGQQVWDASFNERDLKWRSPVKEPKQIQDFLSNMGAFIFHCGASAMGSPGPEDSHPVHGELVYAPYQKAFVDAGEDEKGRYIGVGGEYEHSIAFGHHYKAQPYMRLYENTTLIEGTMRFINLKQTPMEYMYLAHINFLPVDYGRFVYSAKYDSDHVRVREGLPDFIKPTPAFKDFMKELVDHPEKHHILTPDLVLDPEIVFNIDYLADQNGWAHAMHIHPDGTADYVTHQPAQLDHGVRWICRTPDQEALGMEAGTAGVEGYTAEKKKGNIKVLEPGGTFTCNYCFGLLSKEEAKLMEEKIKAIQ